MANYQSPGRRSPLFAVATITLTLIIGGLIGALIVHSESHKSPPRSNSPTSKSNSAIPTTNAPKVLDVVSVNPVNDTKSVNGNEPISIAFSAPISKNSPLPTLSPTTPGSWRSSGDNLTFTPTTDFLPLSTVTLSIPSGSSGVTSIDGGRLNQTISEHFRIMNGSVARLQQLLSLLDFSPLIWTATSTSIATSNNAAQIAALYHPPVGIFAWQDTHWPARLRAMWQPGVNNVFTRGLVMSFQADHGLATNGHVDSNLWSTLLSALAANTLNTGGYNWALANKATPQSLTIYHNGDIVLRSTANTGIANSPTPDGTFPVYTRLRRQVMHGTNPNGQHYADLVQYIAYFKGNDAVHYMDRADYGIPQSLGCIELPLASAAHAWPYLAYGTLVTIVN